MTIEKETIRKQILALRASLPQTRLDEAESSAANILGGMKEYQNSRTVMAYMDFRKEVPTGKIIRQILKDGKRLVLPLTDSNFNIIPYEITPEREGIKGNFDDLFLISSLGIREPDPSKCPEADPQLIDLILVPGSVFDHAGNRIGYGKGCYDHFLPDLRPHAYKLALAYSFQLLDQIPVDSFDVKLDGVLAV